MVTHAVNKGKSNCAHLSAGTLVVGAAAAPAFGSAGEGASEPTDLFITRNLGCHEKYGPA